MEPRPLQDLLRRQNGVISNTQALDAGLSARVIRRRVATGTWIRVGHLVYRAADHPASPRARARAAVMSVGEDATLVGRSAVWWWRLADEPPPTVEVAVPPARRPRPRPGVSYRRRPVAAADRVVVDGVAVTSKAVSVLAAGADLGLVDGAKLVDRALQDGAVSMDMLRSAHLRGSGQWGSVLAARLIALAAGGARSEAERMSHAALHGAGITGWAANLEILLPRYGRVFGDLVFVEQRIVVEVDGWAYHRGLRAFLVDAARQNALAAAGWTVLRTNWFELRDTPEVFLAALRDALAERSPKPERHALPIERLATRKSITR